MFNPNKLNTTPTNLATASTHFNGYGWKPFLLITSTSLRAFLKLTTIDSLFGDQSGDDFRGAIAEAITDAPAVSFTYGNAGDIKTENGYLLSETELAKIIDQALNRELTDGADILAGNLLDSSSKFNKDKVYMASLLDEAEAYGITDGASVEHCNGWTLREFQQRQNMAQVLALHAHEASLCAQYALRFFDAETGNAIDMDEVAQQLADAREDNPECYQWNWTQQAGASDIYKHLTLQAFKALEGLDE